MRTILVTGGAGFIGCNFIRYLLREHPDYSVCNLDKLTYAGNLENLRDLSGHPRYTFVQGDICDAELANRLVKTADAVVNFAAETHVDRSLLDASPFITANVLGTFVLLRAASESRVKVFLHISTDEVYGEMPPGTSATETSPLKPRSPYAASKAGADLQCLACFETYNLPVVIARPTNNVGPFQHPEKAVPLFTTNSLEDKPLPIYGDGRQRRDWLYVEDHCQALDVLLHRGQPGNIYNIGAGNERENIEVAQTILRLLGKPQSLIKHVEDRKGHDRRYSLDFTKIQALGWRPRHDFESALASTVKWYQENSDWWHKAKSGQFARYYEQQYGRRLAGGNPGQGGKVS